jgi:hypothetical protein
LRGAITRLCSRGRRKRGPAAALLAALLGLLMQAAQADELVPFQISYSWSYHGMIVAVTTLELVRRDAETWVYRSKSEPRGIGRLLSERPRMESVMRVTSTGVQPLSYKATAGGSSTARDADVTYDWQTGRVSGVYDGSPLDIPLRPGIQDDLSVQIAMMVDLLRGHPPEGVLLLDKGGVRQHQYTREGEEALATKIGEVPTVIYRSAAQYSPRATRFWCAPERGYIPMRVQQTKGDSAEWTMELESLKRTGGR